MTDCGAGAVPPVPAGQHTPPAGAVEAARDLVADAAIALQNAMESITAGPRERQMAFAAYADAWHAYADVIAAQAAAEEREACAQLAEQYHVTVAYQCPAGDCDDNCGAILPLADLIRARGAS